MSNFIIVKWARIETPYSKDMTLNIALVKYEYVYKQLKSTNSIEKEVWMALSNIKY